MALILSGDSPRKKEYQDNADWTKSLTASAQMQPVNRRINGNAIVQHVAVREYKARATVCTPQKCGGTPLESPVTITIRISGPIGEQSTSTLWEDVKKLVAASGDLNSPVLSKADFS